VVGRADRLLIVLHHQERIAQIAQGLERVQQTPVVAGVEADARLVQHVQHAYQAAADLGREPDPLALPSGQVAEPDVRHEAEARADLLENRHDDLRRPAPRTLAHHVEELQRLVDRELQHVGDPPSPHRHGQALGPQARAATRLAGRGDHVGLEGQAHPVGLRLPVATRGVGDRALPIELRVALQNGLPLGVLQLAPGGAEREPVLFGQGRQDSPPQPSGRPSPRKDDAFHDRDLVTSHDQRGIGPLLKAEAVAIRTGPVRRVEAELTRLQLGDAQLTGRAGVLLAEQVPPIVRRIHPQHLDRAGRNPESRAHGVGQSLPIPLPNDHSIHDHRDVVVRAAVQSGRIAQLHQLAVHPRPHEPLLDRLLEQIAELAFAAPDEGGEDFDLRSLGPGKDLLGDLGGRLRANGPAAVGAMRGPGPCPEESEVIVDLGDRADGRAGVPARAPLLDRDRRGEPLDLIHVGLLEDAEELTSIRRERLHVPALSLGVNRVEDER
jgi:hypothetical protein